MTNIYIHINDNTEGYDNMELFNDDLPVQDDDYLHNFELERNRPNYCHECGIRTPGAYVNVECNHVNCPCRAPA